jgi:hypothetical protein
MHAQTLNASMRAAEVPRATIPFPYCNFHPFADSSTAPVESPRDSAPADRNER